MSAKYKCNVCKKVIPARCNKFETYEFIEIEGTDLRVRFIVDFNQWTEKDICPPCALEAIPKAAKQVKLDINNINTIKHWKKSVLKRG